MYIYIFKRFQGGKTSFVSHWHFQKNFFHAISNSQKVKYTIQSRVFCKAIYSYGNCSNNLSLVKAVEGYVLFQQRETCVIESVSRCSFGYSPSTAPPPGYMYMYVSFHYRTLVWCNYSSFLNICHCGKKFEGRLLRSQFLIL